MKTSKIYSFLCLILIGLASCTTDELEEQTENVVSEIRQIKALVADYGALTRSELYREDDAIKFRWALGDTLGIFPDAGSQAFFAIEPDQAGSLEASFDGGGWALKKAHSYVAYYPYTDKAGLKNNAISLDYTGQIQTGNNTYTHLGKFDYLASDAVSPEAGKLGFVMNHQGSILLLQLTVPEAGEYKYCKLSAESEIFTTLASLNISGDSPVVTSKEKSKSITLELNNVKTTTPNEVITLSMMVYPVNLISKTINVSLFEKGGNVYTGSIDETKNLEKGKPYQMTATLSFDRVDSYGVISFADSRVKGICISNWDTNGDGELSLYEAANVTSINTIFKNNTNILSFNEFKYFSGIQYITSDAFNGCTNLESIELPASIIIINTNAFYNCTKLKKIVLNENLTNIGSSAFYNCSALETIAIPAKVNTIGSSAFYGCSKLRSITIPEGVTTIPTYTFARCTNLNSINLPSTLNKIGRETFLECSNLSRIDIPANVNQIDASAFSSCTNLFDITLPEGLTKISDGLFGYCTNLFNISIPSSVTSIGGSAFYGCSNLIEVTFPESVRTINSDAFNKCISMTKITILNTNVPTLYSGAFNYTNDCPIYVPAIALDNYKSSWSNYRERIQAIP